MNANKRINLALVVIAVCASAVCPLRAAELVLAEGDAIQCPDGDAMMLEQPVHHGQEQLGMAMPGTDLPRVDRAVTPERNRAMIGGGLESEDLHAADEYYPAVHASV